MRIGLLVLELFLPGSASLKDKRKVVKSLQDRVRQRMNVACSETAHQDLRQRAEISFVSVASSEQPLDRLFDKIVDEAERLAPGGVREAEREMFG